MSTSVTVEARLLGRKRPLVRDLPVALSVSQSESNSPFTLSALISQVVANEVEAFRQRQAERRLLHVLSPADIESGVAAGKISMGGSDLHQEVDSREAIEVALQAFEDGLYFVFVDGQQILALNEPITVYTGSHVTFVRLVALAGG